MKNARTKRAKMIAMYKEANVFFIVDYLKNAVSDHHIYFYYYQDFES
jgi:hypothetical protein